MPLSDSIDFTAVVSHSYNVVDKEVLVVTVSVLLAIVVYMLAEEQCLALNQTRLLLLVNLLLLIHKKVSTMGYNEFNQLKAARQLSTPVAAVAQTGNPTAFV